MSQGPSPSLASRLAAKLRQRAGVVIAAMVLAGGVAQVAAHNLQTRMVYMFLDGPSQACLDARIDGTALPAGCTALPTNWAPGQPILQVGDQIGIITKVIPDPSGTTTGVGGHVDFYVPNGVTVMDVGYMIPDGNGGFTKAGMKGQSPIAVGAGPIGAKTTAELSSLASVNYASPNGLTTTPVGAGGTHRGSIAGVYGDTGIFFSTDPSTAWGSWQTFTGDSAAVGKCGSAALNPNLAGKTITNNSGDVIVPCNKWDAEQLFAWGAKGTSYTGASLRSGVAIVDYPDQRGNAPWGFASGVAGPQSGYAWAFDWDAYIAAGGVGTDPADVLAGMGTPTTYGPWQRIQYTGSRISFDQPGSTSTTLGYASKDASTLGTLVTNLPPTASQTDTTSVKTVRWAVGQLTQDRPEYVWVKIRIDDPTGDFLDASGCPVFHSDTFGGDAGGTDNGKDHLWRYYEPSIFNWNGCYAAGKAANFEFATVGQVIQFKVKAYNLGTQTLTNVKITDSLPSGLTFISAAPVQNTGPNPLVWNVGTLLPGERFESIVTVRVSSAGQISNCMSVTSAEYPTPQQTCDTTVTTPEPFLVQSKDATPTTIAPGAPVTYTLTVSNTGTGATSSPVTFTDFLPTGFAYGSLVSATINGAAVTAAVNTAVAGQVAFTLPAALQPGKQAVVRFTATTSPSLAGGRYCNTFAVEQGGIPLTSGSLGCVDVGSAQIGDTIFRDWNGNGTQDSGEEGIPGVTVTLSGTASATATTNATGQYLFSGLNPGSYNVTVPTPGTGGVPLGYTVTSVPPGQAGTGTTYGVTLTTNQQALTADWGYRPGGTGTIGDQVFEDKNGDGLFNGTDVGIGGVTLGLYEDTNASGTLDTGDNQIATTTTNGSGIYSFTGLDPARSYLVAATDGTGSAVDTYFTSAYYLTSSGNPISVMPTDFTASGNNVTGADFGYSGVLPSSIGDQVFIDTNGDGLYTSGESGIANIGVSLYLDLNGNGQADADELVGTTSTDGTGQYLFPDLGPASYIAVVDTADPDLPGGLLTSAPQITVALPANTNYVLADFPFRPVLAKTVNNSTAPNGGSLTFTLKPNYAGTDLLDTVRIMDPVPLNTTYATSTPVAASTGAYVPIAAVQGSDAEIGTVGLTTSASTLTVGGSVTVTLAVTNTTGATATLTPSLTVEGGAATCGSPSPASATLANNGTQNFSVACALSQVGEYTFVGSASDGTLDWPEGTSPSVLSIASGGNASNIVTWNLGSNTAGIPSEQVSGGAASGLFAFRGTDQSFAKYSPSSNVWAAQTAFGNNVKKGGALTNNGSTKVYGLRGDKQKTFKEYDIATGVWTAKANTSDNVDEGGALQYLTVGANNYVFALLGNSNRFRRYAVTGNSWTNMANTPATVKKGGALTTDGTYLYALQGDTKAGFWRCNATAVSGAGACSGSGASWTALANVPVNVAWGGALARLGDYLYATTGNNTKNFYRYGPLSGTPTWTKMADALGNVSDGGALATDGTNVYALQGKTTALWRYNVSANTWSALSPATFGNVAQGGAMTYVPGSGTINRTNALAAGPSLATTGGSVRVNMTLTSNTAVASVSPSALAATPTGGASASCTLLAPTSQPISAGGSATFAWDCTVTAGSAPGSLTFSASATGTGPATTWLSATANSVLVSPTLSYTATIGTFPASCLIPNTGIAAEQGGSLGSAPSNTTQTSGTACGATIGDFVWADADGDGAPDSGETGIAGVTVWIDADNDGVLDSGESSAVTDANGAYHFYGLAAATYTVRTLASSYPSGYLPTTPVFVTQAVGANATVNTFDFGLQKPVVAADAGSIGDTVWLDTDKDGVQDPGEQPLPGIAVKLYRDLDGDGVIDASDPLVGTDTTDAAGLYQFTDLPIGANSGSPVKYLVQVDETNSTVALPYPYSGGPTTANLGTALDPTTGTTNPRSVSLYAGNADVTNADFGYMWTGTVGDTVFYDTDGDGTQDGGETGAANVTLVIVWDQNGNGAPDLGEPALTSAFTDASGNYSFTDLPPGRYVVEVAGQTVESPTNPGVFETMVPTAAYGENYAVDLPAGGSVLTADFGFIEAARITGTVFHDQNVSGVLDGGEPGLSPITVTLSGTDTSGNPVSKTMETDPSGNYLFLVPPGTYTVTYDTADTSANYPLATTITSYTVSPVGGQEVSNLNFGVAYSGSLGNRVWNDANGDGIQTAGEPGLPGVTVNLYAGNGTTLITSTATDTSGLYSFAGLAAGSYVVKVATATVPAGYTATGEGDPGTACTTSCDSSISATVVANTANNTVDFGYQPPANTYSVTGKVFDDADGSGAFNSESALPGDPVEVCLYQGATLKSCLTVNPSTGNFSFPGVPNGSYEVRVTGSTVPAGYLETGEGPNPGAPCTGAACDGILPVTVSGANPPAQYFGYDFTPGSIVGKVCVGSGDGQCGSGEPALAGVLVTLIGAGPDGFIGTADDTTATATTDVNGAYSFTGLAPNSYQVLETNPAGLDSKADADGGNPDNISVTLAAGQAVTTRDFEDGAGIGDRVWYDTNQDGIQDAAEPGIAGVTVRLFDSSNNQLQVTTTDGSGFYGFSGLASGSYTVKFEPPAGAGYVLSPNGQGTGPLAGSFDSNASGALFQAAVTLTIASDPTIDAGFSIPGAAPARIGDRVWYDTDKDGVQDSGEPGLGGVTVSLYRDTNQDGTPDGAALATVLSDAAGDYEFAGLPAGSYVVGFDLPTGYTRSPLDQGGNDATDSDVIVATGRTASLTVIAGQDLATVDAGYYLTTGTPASLGDRVWYDTDNDGVQDGGEPGVPGVAVTLYDATGTTPIATTTTDPVGAYAFQGLAAGTYTVGFVLPGTAYQFSPTGAGTAATDSDADQQTGRVQVVLTDGQVRSDIDAGIFVSGQSPISIGDYVWKDLDADGTPDANEGLPGADVVLYDSLGNELARIAATATTTTATNYSFTGVPAGGSYRVAVDTSTIAGLVQIADPDAAFDSRTDLINQAAATVLVDFGYNTPSAAITIVKRAVDDSDSQTVLAGGTATFEIQVQNTGNLTLSNIDVTDLLAPNCDAITVPNLAPGATSAVFTCTLSPVVADLTNTAGVTAQPVDGGGNPVGPVLTDSDTTAVDVINPSIDITKTLTPNAPIISGGSAVFSITVTNTGDVALTNVAVTDALAPACDRTSAQLPALANLLPGTGNAVTYSCTLANVTASLTNVASVSGTTSLGGTVTDSANALVEVVVPGLSISKTPDSQTVTTGSTVTFTITVTNTGTATLSPVEVTDAQTPDCDRTTAKGNAIATLAPAANEQYTCTATNVTASFTNTAIATSGALTTSDNAEVTVINPSISILKKTNGSEGGGELRSGFLVTWSYLVTNTGDVPLTGVGVTDDQGVTVTCPQSTLNAGASMTCYGYGMSVAGAYSNTGTATGTPPIGSPVTSNDPSNYTGLDPAVIGNYVWLDENGDGKQDAGEAGIPNLTVTLYSGATAVATTKTDALGGYLFTGLAAGTYRVVVTPATGLNPTWNEDTGSTTPDSETAVTVAAGADHLTADFGYNWVPPTDTTNPGTNTTGAIGDRIWNDADGDGLQDAGEAGIAGVTVTLTGAGPDGIFGNVDDPTPVAKTTDAAGQYIFDGLPKGSYVVTVTPPTVGTWTQTGDPDLGGAQDNRTTTPIVLAPGDVFVNADFGYRPATGSTIGDTIWFDANPDGVQNPGELGIPGVTVALRNAGGDTIATTLTDSAGQYLFAGLPAGSYTVAVTDTGHLLDAQLSYDPDATKDAATTVAVDGTNSVLTADFGYTALNQKPGDGLIGDFVYLDRDGNGAPSPGEGLQGVVVKLFAANGTTLLAQTATNPVGVYGFGGLDATQTYVVKIDTASLPNGGTGMVNTVDPDTANPGDSQSTVNLALTGGQNLLQDFGYRVTSQPAAIGGLLWEDADADGIHQHAATVHRHLAGITVALYDANGDLVGTTATDANGGYLFSGLPAGQYTVDVTDTANLLEGWWHSLGDQSAAVDDTSKADPFTLTVAAGVTNTNVDFGYYNAGAALGNRLWLDSNGNGLQDSAETTGLSGVQVQLLISYPNSAGTTTLVATTDATGAYSFGNLLLDEGFTGAGGSEPTFTISIPTAPVGYAASPVAQGSDTKVDSNNPAGAAATVLKGQTNTALAADPATEPANASYDFGYSPTSGGVVGHLYIDTNGNGSQDPGEPNLANVDVVITDRDNVEHRVTTDANGNYTASGLPAGSASVNVDESDPQYPTGYTQTEGTDPTPVTVPASGSVSAGNDGYQPPASTLGSVIGHLYIDTNADGTQQPGEANLPNVSVTITDALGGTYTVVSNASGDYSASGVLPGIATVNVDNADTDIPSGYVYNKSINSSIADTDPSTVTVPANGIGDAGKDGFSPPTNTLGGVTGRVFIDSNGNGRQEPDEPGIANLDVLVTDKDGTVHRVTTNGLGDYTATGLPAGPVIVALDSDDPEYPPQGFIQTVGTDPTPVTVVAGATADAGLDGFYPPVGVIGNRVWLDENGNSLQDTGEAGIPNVKVELLNAAGDTVLAATYTDSDGGYLFSHVPAYSAYQVRVTPPVGLYPTYDEDGIGTASLSVVQTLPIDKEYLTADFGYNWVTPETSTNPATGAAGAIGDRVWNDWNGNGIQDPGESGIGDVTVRLLIDPDGNGVYDTAYAAQPSAVTDAAGAYVFTGLPAGTYVAVVDIGTLPTGTTWVQKGDPDGTLDNRTTNPVILAPGDVYVNADFGYQPTTDGTTPKGSTIGDRVYADFNDSGSEDAGDQSVPGVTVALIEDTNGNKLWDSGEPVIATDLTDANGNYSFPGLSAGNYVVAVTDTENVLFLLIPTIDASGPPDGVSGVSVDGASNYLDQDFGFWILGSGTSTGTIGDIVFLDRDNDGQFDPGEGIEGVTVELYDGTGANLLGSIVTFEGGQYGFVGLPLGQTYTVKVVTSTLPNNGVGLTNTVDPDGGTASQSLVTLTASPPEDPNRVNLLQDFGYATTTTPNTIGGTLWNDTDADGTLTESGRLAGVTVELRDSNGNLVGTTITDANGDYSFTGLPDGSYTVHVSDAANLLDGWWTSTGPNPGVDGNSQVDPYSVTVSGGVTNTTGDFGYYLTGAALGNRAWNDANNNGLQDPVETGVSGATVSLLVTYPNGDTTTVVTVTDGSGVYRFADLLLDEGFRLSTAGTPGAGTGPSYRISAATAPAGYVVGTKIGQGDGKNDSDPPSGVTAAAIAQGDLDTTLNAANPSAETNNAAYDFAFVPEGSLYGISGTVYNDVNGNGNLAERTGFGGTETALTGVSITVTLYTDPNGDGNPADGVAVGSPVVTTNGTYSFTGLAAGNYVVVETNPSGYVSTNDVDAPNNDRIAVVLTTANAAAQDFLDTLTANSQLGSIAGQVRNDQNGDGNLATGTDPGLPNVKVEIWIDSDNNGTPDTLYDTTTTNSGGNYSFTSVPPGGYVIVETNPNGYTSTNDVTAPNDDRIPLTLPNQGTITGRDFLDSQSPNLSSIAGTVFIDGVGAGNFGDATGGLTGATVTLWTDPNGDGNPVDGVPYGSQTTGSPGTYAFTGLPVGSYVVVETNPSGYTSTNDVSAPNDDRIPVGLPAGGTNVTGRNFLDALNGSAQVAAISGRVIDDANGNGSLPERFGETGINGVTVTLKTDPNGDGDPSDGVVYSTTTTSGNGNYSFPAVPPGYYVVIETDPNGYSSTNDVVGANDNQVPVNRTGTTPVTNADFLDSQAPNLASIGNRVWLDENSNGVQDAGEDGIANVTVRLRDANDAVIATTVTDADGGYLFIEVPAGQYTVEVVTASLATGLKPIADEDDAVSGTLPPATPHVSVLTVIGGAEHLTADFGYNWATRLVTTTPPVNALGAIGDRVWDDANGNGVQEPGEAGIAGVTVRLLTDDNGDGTYGGPGDNSTPPVRTTNATGHYIFTDLSAGAYVVEVTTATLPTALTWTQTADPDGPASTDSRTTTPVILAPGDVFVNADFGYQPTGGHTIGDRVYLDANGDGSDQGQTLEPGIAGVTVALLNGSDQVIATTVTDEYGEYTFPGLPAATYSVVLTDIDHVLGELVQTGDPDSTIDGQSTVVLTNADNLDQDFGFAPPGQMPGTGLIGDTIFLDRNASGQADPGEGLEGVTVALYAANGTTLVATTVTDENGHYAFGGLLSTATYVVRVDTGTLPAGLTNTVDPDNTSPTSQAVRDLSLRGPIDLAADFGYRPTATPNSIAGVVWKDPNADGTRQVGETVRFGGVTVELRDANGDLVGTTVTAQNGTYSFANLPDGTYTVDVTDLDGVLNGTWHSLGTNSQPDPYQVTVNGTLGRSQVADFGYYLDGAALGNRVWKDTNGDGMQQSTETTGLGGTALKLVITYPNGAVSNVYTLSGAANGGYSFGNLLLDENFTGSGTGQPNYVLSVVTAPTGYTKSPSNQGGNAKTDSNNPSGTTATLVKGQTAIAVLADPNSELANASFDFGYIEGTTSCSVICDAFPRGGVTGALPNGVDSLSGDGVVDLSDITWIFGKSRKVVSPTGAPHSGDCVKDGRLGVNDATACQAYLTP